MSMPQHGFSLLEVMLALVITSVVATGLLARQQLALKHVQQSEWHSQAVSLLNNTKAIAALSLSGIPSSWLVAWQDTVHAELPAGQGQVTCSSVCRVTVQWRAYGKEQQLETPI